jgi:hypothetical protein
MVRRFVIALLATSLVLTLAGTAGAQTQEPTLDFTVDPMGTFNPTTGVTTITGTYSCTNASVFVLFVTGGIVKTCGSGSPLITRRLPDLAVRARR